MGEQVHEEVMDMIDREADGSDSLEVSIPGMLWCCHKLIVEGIHATTFNCGWYWLWNGKFST